MLILPIMYAETLRLDFFIAALIALKVQIAPHDMSLDSLL